MVANPSQLRVVKFGVFEVDFQSLEVRKSGMKQKLAGQPFHVLRALLENPHEIVTREQLRQRLWPENTFIDFDLALKKAVNRLREVLGDSAENPHFIETIPRQGYRFIGTIEAVGGHEGLPASVIDPSAGSTRWKWVAGAGLGVLALLLLVFNTGEFRTRIFAGSRPPEIHSLAVLPLSNLSGDPEQEYFADGMTDELITDLAQISALRVISRTSVMHYKGTSKTLPQIARELNADAILEGSVQRSGEEVRIRAQLIYAASDRHLWAESYEGSLRDVLQLQNKVASEIARQIRIQVTPEEKARLTNARPVNLEAHEAYLKGRYYLNQRTENGFQQSVRYFEEAMQKDPSYALGYAGLADTYVLLGEYSLLPAEEAFPKARAAATKALELDDSLAEAHNALAAVKVDYDWDWPGAEREFRRAILLNPGYAMAHQWYSELLSQIGRHDEALAEIQLAEQLDPFSLIINVVYGDALRCAGQNDMSLKQLHKALEIDPNFAHAHFHLGMTYLRKEAFADAIAEFQKAVSLSPNVTDYKGGLGYAYAVAGRRAEARRLLEELKARSKQGYVPWFYLAGIYAGLGDKDQAFANLEKAYEQHEQGLAVMNREPMFDPLREDPRYRELLRRMRYPDAWQP